MVHAGGQVFSRGGRGWEFLRAAPRRGPGFLDAFRASREFRETQRAAESAFADSQSTKGGHETMSVPKPDPRRHARILLDPQHTLRCESAAPKINGSVTVIGLGGMFVRTASIQPFGAELRLRVHNSVTF